MTRPRTNISLAGAHWAPDDATVAPIDEHRLRRALEVANLPTLAMVLEHLTGDRRWLESPYRPTRPRGVDTHDSGGFADEVADEIRSAAFDAIVAWGNGRPVALPNPSSEVLAEMLAACMGEPVPSDYERLMREEMGLEHSAPVRAVDADAARAFSVVIIGAGVSGMLAGANLMAAGIPFKVLERAEDVGGVWLSHRYPGAGVDTPSYLYSVSGFPNNWSTHFARRDEVLAYMRSIADEVGLRENIDFGVEVTGLTYDEDAQRWTIDAREANGDSATYVANVVISAVGLYNKPKRPTIPGLDEFDGPVFHTAEWPEDFDHRGKRIAIIGTGASSMQIVPAIADEVESLTVFQRSPQWAAPTGRYFDPVDDDVHWLMKEVPYYHTWYRFRLAWTFNDRVHSSLRVDPSWQEQDRALNAVNDRHRAALTSYMMDQLEGRPDLQAKALPSYPPFGKRMLIDNGWFTALQRPNVELVADSIAEITPRGVMTSDGREFEVDAIALATGYDAYNYLHGIAVRGRDGALLHDEWGDDDARAYLGISAPHYPNLFFMYGPNTNGGAGGSYIFIAESQISYITGLLTQMIEQGLGAIECRPDVCARWCEEVDEAHKEMIWTHPGMTTFYRNSRGRVVTNMPWRIIDYWSMTRDADLSSFTVEAARSRTRNHPSTEPSPADAGVA